jgi:lysozyme family protein
MRFARCALDSRRPWHGTLLAPRCLMPPTLTPALRDEYQQLFDTCEIRPARLAEVNGLVKRINQGSDRYRQVGDPLGIPWQLVGVIHCMEGSLKFTTHLHNGDPLTARTVHVPKGRPPGGTPPFAWELSATDALSMEGLHEVTEWSVPSLCFRLEKYNGFGYRTRNTGINSPYLWAASHHYARGKFVQDGKFSADAVSKQCGAMVLLRRMAELGLMRFDATNAAVPDSRPPTTAEDFAPLIGFAPHTRTERAAQLQRMLNTFPGIFVLVDGKAGKRTSDALRRVTGHFLVGDPRA